LSSTRPRLGALSPAQAAELASLVPDRVGRVGLFVDVDDTLLEAVLKQVPLTMLQLHGKETPERVQAIKAASACR
jgi:phosphoribosylanthranilate isomerase